MKFELNSAELKLLADWLSTLPELVNVGAIGGELTFEFTPTGLGTITRVFFMKDTPQEKSIDLTDYAVW